METLQDVIDFFDAHPHYHILGKGSNSLIAEAAFSIPFVQLSSSFTSISHSSSSLTTGAGTTVNQLLSYSQKHGLSGFEFMTGVPASVGGMIAMNFGCWGTDVASILDTVTAYIPGKGMRTLSANACDFDYRSSRFQHTGGLVLSATFNITPSSPDAVKSTIHSNLHDRLAKQPLRSRTFGSIFKNPYPKYAAELIDACGLKGHRIGGASISTQHANFMENSSACCYKDVSDMISLVQQKVWDTFNIMLEPEVKRFS